MMTHSGKLRAFSFLLGITMLLSSFVFSAAAFAESPNTLVSSVSFDVKSITLKVGESKTVAAKAMPTNATSTSLKYTVKNAKIAKIDQNGTITALRKGTTEITAAAQDGGNKKGTYKVTVKDAVPTSVSVTPASATIDQGKKVTLKASVLPSVAKNKSVTWKSSNKKVATVSSKGVVTGKGGGTATITATTKAGKVKASATITVIGTVKPASVTLSQKSGTLYVGDNITLIATVNPSNATNKSVTFTSSNKKVATVSSTGKVVAKKEGKAKITVTTKLNKKSATYTVTVKKCVVPTSVSISPTSGKLNVGDSMTFSAGVAPSNATNKSVTWKSSDTSVATVTSGGVVKGIKAGTAKITATTSSGGKTASATVTVSDVVPISVTISPTSGKLNVGDSMTFTASVAPSNAANKLVTFSSSEPSIATVTSDGVVKGVKAGTVTITVKTNSGGKTASATVTVNSSDEVVPTSVTISPTIGKLDVGGSMTFTASVAPSNAANKSVTWKSSDASVATVTSGGVVTGIKAGTATITATTNSNGKTASATVTVSEPPSAPVYRAFLIGQENHYNSKYNLTGPKRDVNSMKSAFEAGGFGSVNVHYDQTASGIVNILSNMSYMDIKSNDVTVFYYSGHGLDSNIAAGRGALVGVDSNYVLVDTVRQLLDRVPGTIIVIMDSCLSGQFISSKSVDGNAETDPDAYNQAVVDAFTSPMAKGIVDDSPVKEKYKILTAASADGDSYTLSGISVFTKYLSTGCGYDPFAGKCVLKADSNGNNKVTMAEAYNYIVAGVKIERSSYPKIDQSTQLWPANDQFVLASR